MAENEIIQLHKAIFAQYIMMKKLFMELEEEREASATAASAALSLIRKLQKEKDAERMEAWQYKRITEEKMNHTDRTLEILKEMMEQKELEISYLRNQLQVYKHKLLDVGINDCDIADETIATNIPLSESKSVENPCHNIKRNFSLPTLQLNKLFADTDINKNDGAVQSARSRLDGHMYNVSDNEWEQILRDGKASEPMKSLSMDINCKGKNGEELNPPSSGILQQNQPSNESLCCSSSVVSHQTDVCNERVLQATEDVMDTLHSDQLKDFCLGSELDGTAVHPTTDVYAVQNPERSKTETDASCTESDIVTEESESSITVAPKERGSHTLSRFAATRKVGSMNNVDRHVRISNGSSTPRSGVQRTKSRLKRVQSEKMVEMKDPKTNKEQIIKLKEVYQQLNMIESHMRPSGSHESPRNDTSLNSVMEVLVFLINITLDFLYEPF
jgi:serine/threonine-protein phosphatase 2B regulatory subunit